jgi:arylformamidase
VGPSVKENRVPDVDYEAEYNARAMVPEHPGIFARWNAEAARFKQFEAENTG